MVVPLWEIGRSRQLLSCKELEINQPRTLGMGQDAAGRIAHFETMSMAERRYAQSVAQEELAADFANTHKSGNQKESLFRVDSRSVFLLAYIHFTVP
jgi:hypothetical protein